MTPLGIALMICSLFFFATTTISMLRFADFYVLLHASSKCLVGGMACMIVAFMVEANSMLVLGRLTAVLLFLLLTSPIASHVLINFATIEQVDSPDPSQDRKEE